MDIHALSEAGINISEGIERFSGHSEIYEKYLKKFPEDTNYAALCQAIEAKDASSAFKAAHALKGLAGNLSITKLYASLSPLVENLRGGSLENADSLLALVRQDYESTVAILTK